MSIDSLISGPVSEEIKTAKKYKTKIIPVNITDFATNEDIQDVMLEEYNHQPSKFNTYEKIKDIITANIIWGRYGEQDPIMRALKEEFKEETVVKLAVELNRSNNLVHITKIENIGIKPSSINETKTVLNSSEEVKFANNKIMEPKEVVTVKGDKVHISKNIIFTIYRERYELNQTEFMTKVYEAVLNRNHEKLDLVVESQQNVAYADNIPENKKNYFRPAKEIVVHSPKVWIGT